MNYPRPANETARLEALRRYEILDTPAEPELDDITALAAHICGTPTALITFIDADRQWFKSRVGWTEAESSREASFCAHAIVAADGGELIVVDATRDPRFCSNPYVTSNPPAVRFYAGVPLVTPDGHALGALCVIDRVPRTLSAEQLAALRSLRRAVVRELELRKTRAELAIVTGSLEREGEEGYRRFAESSPDAILIHCDERIVFANRAMAELLGAGAVSELVGKASTFMLRPEYREAAIRRTRAFYAGEAQPRTEQIYVRLDGSEVHVEIAASPFRLAGRPAAHVTVRDISERYAAEQRVRAALDRFEILARATNDAVWDWDLAANAVWWNPGFYAMFGYEPGELEPGAESWTNRIHPEDAERVVAGIHEAINGHGSAWNDEYRFRRADGSYADVWDRGFIIRGEPGKAVRAIGAMMDLSQRKAADRATRRAMDGLRRAQGMAKLAHVVTGPDGVFQEWSETLPALAGVGADEVPPSVRDWLNLVHEDDREIVRSASIRAAQTGQPASVQYRVVRPDGSLVYLRQEIEPLGEEAGGERRWWFITMQDVTEHKRVEQRIERLTRIHAMLSGINALIVRVRDREELFREASRVAVEQGGFRMAWIGLVDREAGLVRPVASAGDVGDFFESAPLAILESAPGGRGLAGRAVREMKPLVSNDVRRDPKILVKKALEARGINSLAILPIIVRGDAIGVLSLGAAELEFFDEEETKLLAELTGDISFALEHLANLAKLDYLAYYDELTGLANHSLFRERVTQRVRSATQGQRVAVGMIDLERFRAVNDALGRGAGDELLREVAARLRLTSREEPRLARIGADQFAVVVDDARGEDEVRRLAEARMHKVFGEPYRLGGQELIVGGRVGIAIHPKDGNDADTLIRNAEAALKNAKTAGERLLFYAPEMNERVAGKLALESQLRRALENEEFVLHYQPKVDMESRRTIGLEALIRWRTADRGLVPPAQFIPLLEETGLILQVGAWALRRAALDHRAWTESGIKAPRVAVNVSAIQLRQRDFVGIVEQAILEGLAPTAIDLEITESLLMQDVRENIEKLKAVRALGVQIAIDDFGTGYSSLGYLSQLPVQYLKIDRSFIMRMHDDANAMTLVSTMITLARSLQLKVVAEGVETEDQAKFLRLLRCDQMQGYLFSKPLPAEELVKLLENAPGGARPGA
ncbi:MAG TPA: EAL domain-containing protein [Burkholderiales bacterium]|nr:EAL domain-containing protein [Burkholderiales bacterium]